MIDSAARHIQDHMPRSEGRIKGRWDSLAYGLRMLPAVALAACATYKAAPLPTAVDWAQDLAALDVSPSPPLPEAMDFHAFDPSDGLDDMEVAMLAVANNSDLRARRAAVGVNEAQVFTAGLLPDPQLSLTADFPMLAAAGTTTAFNLGLSYDWTALLVRGSARRAAAAELRGARMSLLWQEWQVVNQARLLFVRIVQARRTSDLLDYRRALLRDRLDAAQRALRRGDLTLDAELAYRTALGDVERLRTDLRRTVAKDEEALNDLLGLRPGARLELRVAEPLGGLTAQEMDLVRARLPDLPRRRPDLIALQAGYGVQDARLRQAILIQFPGPTVGISRARDTAGLATRGLSVSMALPVFNRNRGQIAIEAATREKLKADYQARLNAATRDIERILIEHEPLAARLRQVEGDLRALQPDVQAVDREFRSNAVDILTYTTFQGALLAKRQEAAALRLSLSEQRIALQTLLGAPVKSLEWRSPSATLSTR